MKKIIFLTLIALFVSSCAVKSIITTGEYYGPTYGSKGGAIILFLHQDQSFGVSWRGRDYAGKWEQIDCYRVRLIFNEITDPAMFLASGMILDSVKEIRFMNKKKIIMDYNSILKRQK